MHLHSESRSNGGQRKEHVGNTFHVVGSASMEANASHLRGPAQRLQDPMQSTQVPHAEAHLKTTVIRTFMSTVSAGMPPAA
jgi:hypothetical protein